MITKKELVEDICTLSDRLADTNIYIAKLEKRLAIIEASVNDKKTHKTSAQNRSKQVKKK